MCVYLCVNNYLHNTFYYHFTIIDKHFKGSFKQMFKQKKSIIINLDFLLRYLTNSFAMPIIMSLFYAHAKM